MCQQQHSLKTDGFHVSTAVSADPPFVCSLSQPSRMCFRRGWSSHAPYVAGAGRPGQTWGSISNAFRRNIILNPQWANLIKNMIWGNNQVRAVNRVANALDPSATGGSEDVPLHVINDTVPDDHDGGPQTRFPYVG
jgi:hypothetical protein